MSWQERLRPLLELTSPEGNNFAAKWQGDDVTIEKRVGRFALYGLDKELVWDYGINSPDFPLTLYFDGPDHDKTASRFLAAFSERGAWQVVHPVFGLLTLQPLSCSPAIDPTGSGGVTAIKTEWVEPASRAATFSIIDSAAEVEAAVEELNAATIWDIISGAASAALAEIQALADKARSYAALVKNAIQAVNDRALAIQNAINSITSAAVLDAASLAGAVVQLVESPGLMLGSAASRVGSFARLGKRITDDITRAAGFTRRKTGELLSGTLFLNAIAAAMGKEVIAAPGETRQEALSALSLFAGFIRTAKDAVDAAARSGGEKTFMADQFFSSGAATETLLRLSATVKRHILDSMYTLKGERIIILDRPRSPLEIAITEYEADAGNIDSRYEFFCRTNNLHGRDMLLLPAGREVRLYL